MKNIKFSLKDYKEQIKKYDTSKYLTSINGETEMVTMTPVPENKNNKQIKNQRR